MNRRRLLQSTVGVAGVVALAGCSSPDESDDDTDDEGTESGGVAVPNRHRSIVSDTEVPRVSISFQYTPEDDDGSGYVEIEHESGDALDPSTLWVFGHGIYTAGDGQWNEQATSPDGDNVTYETVSSGDSIYVDVDSHYRMSLHWSPNGVGTAVLAESTGPDA